MVTIFTVASLNIALGFAIAYLLSGRNSEKNVPEIKYSDKVLGRVCAQIIPVEKESVQNEPVSDVQNLQQKLSSLMPQRWTEMLGDIINRIETVEEAAALVANQQIANITQKLSTIDERLKHAGNSMTEWTKIISENRQFLGQWSEINRQYIEELRDDSVAIEPNDPYWLDMDKIVQNHITATEQMIRQLDDAGSGSDQHELLESMRQCIPMICDFKNRVNEKLASIYIGEKAIEIRDRTIRIDASTGVFSRAGIATIFKQWWENDPARERVATVALFDICDTAAINRRFGYEITNQILDRFVEKLQGSTRQNRGFDRLARYSGQQVFMILGDTSLSNSVRTVARFCDMFDSMEFHVGGEVIFLPVNATITPLYKEDTIEYVLNRLERALPMAKQHGPNAKVIYEGEPRLATEKECQPLGLAPVSIE